MKKILLIDDDIVSLLIAKEALSGYYSISMVTSAEQGLKFLKSQKADVILLDIMMPGMDGFAMLDEIRKMPNCQDVPVIFLTSLNDKDTVESALKNYVKLGVVDYIIKPFEKETLPERISLRVFGTSEFV